MKLTSRQHEIIKYIWKYRKRKGLAPTLAEIAAELNVSKVTIHEQIAQLEKKGALEKEPFLSRSTRLTRRMLRELERTVAEQQRFVGVDESTTFPPSTGVAPPTSGPRAAFLPLLGEIAAGRPLEAIEERELVDITDLCQFTRAKYMLRVKGDSMIEDGIRDGDYVLVEQRDKARDGETVVAVLENNEATLRRFYRQRKRFKLEPANASLKPIYTDKLEIRGVVVGFIRRCEIDPPPEMAEPIESQINTLYAQLRRHADDKVAFRQSLEKLRRLQKHEARRMAEVFDSRRRLHPGEVDAAIEAAKALLTDDDGLLAPDPDSPSDEGD